MDGFGVGPTARARPETSDPERFASAIDGMQARRYCSPQPRYDAGSALRNSIKQLASERYVQ